MRASDMAFPYSSDEKNQCLEPLMHAIRRLHRSGNTIIVGIQGGQGTGKTTLADYLVNQLSEKSYCVTSFSIDDFYTSYEERQKLATQHPGNPWYQLFRGMPGTHRTDLLYDVLACFQRGEDVAIPVFDKTAHQARGDVTPDVTPVRGRQDVVIFEGWCIGAEVTPADELTDICRRHGLLDISPLPISEHLNAVLANLAPYQRIWQQIDFLVMLRPDFPTLHAGWRIEREQDLIARTGIGMTERQVYDHVHPFLPISYLCYEKVTPDMRISINEDHRFYDITSLNKEG